MISVVAASSILLQATAAPLHHVLGRLKWQRAHKLRIEYSMTLHYTWTIVGLREVFPSGSTAYSFTMVSAKNMS